MNEFKNLLENMSKELGNGGKFHVSDVAQWYGIEMVKKIEKSKLVFVDNNGFVKLNF